jgi:hypothetical protein
MKSKIAEDLGRLFEVGFNIGILAYIQQNKISNKFLDLYRQELEHLKFPHMLERVKNKFVSHEERKMVDTWCTFFLQKGFLSGLNFFREYIQSMGWDANNRLKHVEIIYLQCCFNGDNSIGTYNINDEGQWLKKVLSQLSTISNLENINQHIATYKRKGEFLNADTLILLRYRRQYRIVCVDLSAFSIRIDEDVINLDYIEIIRRLLLKDINYLRSKSIFSKIRIDTESLDFNIAGDLKNYFSAFKYNDKESAKLIQAGGYAYSFYNFLHHTGLITDDTSLVLNAIGYSDRSICTISITSENLEVLKNCYEIYKYDSSNQEINAARQLVLNKIKRSAYSSFQNGKEFIDQLLSIQPNHLNILNPITENITDFYNSVAQLPAEILEKLHLTGSLNLREGHEKLISKALSSEDIYLFLTGNPGIGKTTAIVNYLKDHINEGFLFFYVSPRKQVNLDIIEKFKVDGKLCDDKLIAINSNSNLVEGNFGKYTVEYTWNNHQNDFTEKTVDFINSNIIERQSKSSDKLKRCTDESLQAVDSTTKGVLSSICKGVSTIIESQLSNNIIATASIQSLRKTNTGNTLKHLEKIFQSAYNERDDMILPHRMQGISRRIKNLFIMIDEITGDEGGVHFLAGIDEIVKKYQLNNLEFGFNTKIIVADASIVDKNIIQQHLSDTLPEPDKIYFRRAPLYNYQTDGLTEITTNVEKIHEFPLGKNVDNQETDNQVNLTQPNISQSNISQGKLLSIPLSMESLEFKGLPGRVINANSYPARSLSITYKLIIESIKYSEYHKAENKSIYNQLESLIIGDIETLLKRDDIEQFIVYIQNKRKLGELIDKIQEKTNKFEQFSDYLEIHANISELEKQKIQECKNKVKVIFMTASGSRGLSFPKAKNILVEVPQFEIEKNLMEIIQVIYRGRGDENIDSQDKELIFYLTEKSIYFDNQGLNKHESNKQESNHQEADLSIKESILGILNILLILKAAIMTRICGYGAIGRENFIIIPIGGKSIETAGSNFSSQIASLIKLLKNESHRNPSDSTIKKVYKNLEKLLSQGDFRVKTNTKSNYLTLQKSFNTEFNKFTQTLDKLLNFGDIEAAHISGNMLIIPMENTPLIENYQIITSDQDKYANHDILKSMEFIAASKSYPENLRFAIKDAIELVNKLMDEKDKTQKLKLSSKRPEQYYSLPLFAFICGEIMEEYFSTQPDEPEDQKFRDILEKYLRVLYPIDDVLPIGSNYEDFPFILFKSFNLQEIREKIFTEKYLFHSNELNVLNLLLSKE